MLPDHSANTEILMTGSDKPRFRRVVRRERSEAVQRVFSEHTTAVLREMLQAVVDSGTATAARIEGLAVAGKTGTAQKVEPLTGRYSHRKIVASFVGAIPAEAPRLVILVMIDEPETLRWGGSIAAPTFREIARDAVKYLKVTPSPARDVRLVRSG